MCVGVHTKNASVSGLLSALLRPGLKPTRFGASHFCFENETHPIDVSFPLVDVLLEPVVNVDFLVSSLVVDLDVDLEALVARENVLHVLGAHFPNDFA